MEENWKRVIGIDLSKRTYEAFVIIGGPDKESKRFNGKLDPGGQHRLQSRLKEGDLVLMEAGIATFRLVRYLAQKKGIAFTVLNPSQLRIIFDTVCKTDREDAKKLAQLGLKFSLDCCFPNYSGVNFYNYSQSNSYKIFLLQFLHIVSEQPKADSPASRESAGA